MVLWLYLGLNSVSRDTVEIVILAFIISATVKSLAVKNSIVRTCNLFTLFTAE